jgi:Immunity protein 53
MEAGAVLLRSETLQIIRASVHRSPRSVLLLGCSRRLDMDTLQDLQRWSHSQRDSDGEHGYRVEIGTLDNPGWRVSINLVDTSLAEQHSLPLRGCSTRPNDRLLDVLSGCNEPACWGLCAPKPRTARHGRRSGGTDNRLSCGQRKQARSVFDGRQHSFWAGAGLGQRVESGQERDECRSTTVALVAGF